MIQKEDITRLINEAKKEIDRLEARRSTALGNSINYVENEIRIQRLESEIEAYEKVLNLV
ncbi:hypothetical protein ACWN8V_10310 [Vagococcus elongatus]|uniref:Uncharacterized protein n=1 Tax=Vagococcus elongatus TaxID=180344 RepID=A0A430AQ90_9ENTE|nr:hypothetical protein [Vagococcus elongatus]RSU10143.1 hypothetical protein CBF29_10165 [Vagococcus elongatus]